MIETVTKPLILIADDDTDYLFQIRFALEKAGYQVLAAETMDEAGFFLDERKPDLAIFDLMMERADAGFVLAYHAKKKYPGMPVILLTAVTSETGMQFGEGEAAGSGWVRADRYLEKGLHTDQLIGHVQSLLSR